MKISKVKHNGAVTTPILVLIGVFSLCFFTAFIIKKLEPVLVYINLNMVTRKYALKMETTGYLTPDYQNNLDNDLAGKNFDLSDVTINPSTTLTKVGYGEDVTLEIHYIYKYTDWELDGISVTTVNKEQSMTASASTTSKCK